MRRPLYGLFFLSFFANSLYILFHSGKEGVGEHLHAEIARMVKIAVRFVKIAYFGNVDISIAVFFGDRLLFYLKP